MIEMKIDVACNEIGYSKAYSDWVANVDKNYLEYRRMWRENPQNNIVGSFPLHISFESTNACNLECVFCSRTIKKKEGMLGPTRIMPIGLFEKVIDEGVGKGLKAIKLNTGDTEPLMVKDLPERIAYAKEAGVLEVMFNTNATLLNENKAKMILESGLDKILISFDSPNKERYESVRIGARYEEVKENIYRFFRLKKEQGLLKPFVQIQMVKMKENAHEIDSFFKMFKDSVDIIRIGEYYNRQELVRQDLRASKKKVTPTSFTCSQLWQRLHIRVDGTVIPCCGDVTNLLVLGNANDSDLESLWKGEKIMRYRKLHLTGKWGEIEACSKCGIQNTQ